MSPGCKPPVGGARSHSSDSQPDAKPCLHRHLQGPAAAIHAHPRPPAPIRAHPRPPVPSQSWAFPKAPRPWAPHLLWDASLGLLPHSFHPQAGALWRILKETMYECMGSPSPPQSMDGETESWKTEVLNLSHHLHHPPHGHCCLWKEGAWLPLAVPTVPAPWGPCLPPGTQGPPRHTACGCPHHPPSLRPRRGGTYRTDQRSRPQAAQTGAPHSSQPTALGTRSESCTQG